MVIASVFDRMVQNASTVGSSLTFMPMIKGELVMAQAPKCDRASVKDCLVGVLGLVFLGGVALVRGGDFASKLTSGGSALCVLVTPTSSMSGYAQHPGRERFALASGGMVSRFVKTEA